MENRRQTYRHSFTPEDAIGVEVLLSDKRTVLHALLLDLSITGMRIRLAEADALAVNDLVTARLLNRASQPAIDLFLSLPACVKYIAGDGPPLLCGLHFVPCANPLANDRRELALSRFLASEQRRSSRRRRG